YLVVFLSVLSAPQIYTLSTRRSSDLVGRIKRASDRMARLINDLLDLSRIEAGKLSLNETTFPARELVHEIVEMFRPGAAEKQVQDRKSTRLNSSHVETSYAVFCLKKK